MDAPRVRAGLIRPAFGRNRAARRSRHAALAAVLAAVLLTAGGIGVWQVLAHRDAGGPPSTGTPVTLGAVPSIAATLPDDIKSRGG